MQGKSIVLRSPPWVSAAPEDSWAFVEAVLNQVRPGERVLDVGTGTGIVAITLARAGVPVTATDVSAAAVRAAQANAARNGTRFPCYQSDLLGKVQGRFNLIAFNPPVSFGRDSLMMSIVKNLLRRIGWVRGWLSKGGVPEGMLRFRERLVGELLAQAPGHLDPGGRVMLHLYESEARRLGHLAPPGAGVEVLNDEQLRAHGTAALVIRFP